MLCFPYVGVTLINIPFFTNRLLAVASLAFALLSSAPIQAQNTWTGSISENWFDTGNWTGSELPSAGEHVRIDALDLNPTVIDGQVGESGWLSIGYSAAGSLTIANAGSLVSSSSTLGNAAAGDGNVRVTGTGSTWTVGGSYFEIGQHGSGELLIENGAQVHSTGLGGFGRSSASASGIVTVTGAGSVWHSGSMYVGWNGSGLLTISDGGQVFFNPSNAVCSIGFQPSGQGQVVLTGPGSLLQTGQGHAQIGNFGSGSLLLADHATLAVLGSGLHGRIITLARFASATGTLIVGAPAGEPPAAPGQIDALALQFGAGAGHVVFNHSDTLTLPVNVVGPTGSGTALLSFLAGTTLFDGQPDSVNGEDFDYSGLTMVAAGATFGAAGSFGDIANHGTLVPGADGVGSMIVDGDYLHDAGARLSITVGPNSASGFIQVTGSAVLQGGTVSVALAPGPAPLAGLHPILSADGGITGQFDGLAPGADPRRFILVQLGDTVYLDVSDQLFRNGFE